MSADGSNDREIISVGFRLANTYAWAPDGWDLLFTLVKVSHQELTKLWRISAEGGEPRKLWEWNKRISALRVHPDGQHIAFGSGTNKSEVWVMENFLPAEK